MSDGIPASAQTGTGVQTLLVATDLSAESRKALHYAAAMARAYGATLHVVHVSEIDYAIPGPALLGDNPFTSETEDARSLREQLAADIGKSVAVTFHGRTGRAYDQICRLARELKADLIVMATHGRTGFRRLFLGSNAERVVQHSRSPVLIVREHEHELLTDDEQLAVHRILVPTDFSASSCRALEYAVDLAQQFDASIVLFHSFSVPEFTTVDACGPHHVCPSPDELQRAAEAQMREFVDAFGFEGVKFETQVRAGGAAEQICDYAAREKLDLIVTSTHGRTGLWHVLIGSVAEHVVRYARCPVLVVPARERVATQG